MSKDASEWRFFMTDKGKKRAKSLCRNVGILVSVEIDIENPTTNKITINLYDKDVMPLVDELYQVESSRLKGEDITDNNGLAQPNSAGGCMIFEEFIGTIENEIDSILMEDIGSLKKGSKASIKSEQQLMMMGDVFVGGNNLEEEEEEPELEAESAQPEIEQESLA